MKAPKTFLVTGGSGFLGSFLCQALVEKGAEVFCLDNLKTSQQANVAGFLEQKNFHWLEQDITKPLSVKIEQSLPKLDWILNFASIASPPQYQKYPIETMQVNYVGTLHMLELAKKHEAKFIQASTSEVYGEPKVHPQKEDYWGNVNPIGVRSCYDESKRAAEALVMSYIQIHQMHAQIIRIFNTYGPRMQKDDGRVVSNFINQALTGEPLTIYGKGTQTRSFCYVQDLINAILRIVELSVLDNPINLGNPHECTVLELAQQVLTFSGSSSKLVYKPLPHDDPTRRCPNIEKANSLLQWQPKISLEQGLKQTIAYFKGSHTSLQK